MKKFEIENIIYSDLFQCEYATGNTEEGDYIYVWSMFDASEYSDEMLENPECMNGAMIGTLEEITEEIEECVGGFRYHGGAEQQKESAEIVETLLDGLK